MKCIIILLVSLLCFYGVNGNPCASYTSGDWCSGSGYVSCPNTAVRACQAGLVCQQFAPGTVYCVRPSESQNPSTSAPVVTPAPTTRPATPAPTPKPTTPPSDDDEWECDEDVTPAPSTTGAAPTSAPTTRPTSAPTARPTSAPITPPLQPTTRPVTPTSAPTSAPTAPAGGRWPFGNPVKAIYIDDKCWAPGFSFNQLVDAGYNLIVLAFLVNTVSLDCTIAWGWMTQDQQKATIQYAHSKGARIIVSAGGATDFPYNLISGAAYARSAAQWAVNNNLDGIDFDLENFGRDFTFAGMSHDAVLNWVVDATNTARTIMGTNAVICHAPQPPYFGNFGWGNGYGKLYQRAPHIDFFLVQFYNNGPTNTYETIFIANNNGASVTQIAALGIPMNKIVVGKPVHSTDISDLSQGYNTAAELNAMFARAKRELGWNAGVMGWQWLAVSSNTAWINTIYPK